MVFIFYKCMNKIMIKNKDGHIRGIVKETLWTWVNLITVIRDVVCIGIFTYAFIHLDLVWNYIGLGIYWLLDSLDGFVARSLNQETRFGAQFDIISDRILVLLFYLNFLTYFPALYIPVVSFLICFIGIDLFLSLQMMRWPIKSPNYFYVVDQTIWCLNWSVIGKSFNTALFTLVICFTHSILLSMVVVGIILIVKGTSFYLLRFVPNPERNWD